MKIDVYFLLAVSLQMTQDCNGVTARTFQKVGGECPGIRYLNNCFIGRWINVDEEGAELACANLGGMPTNIYCQRHMDVLMKYVRNASGGDMKFHTGMHYYSEQGDIRFRNGTIAPVGMKWAPDFPMLHKDWNSVYLRVQSSAAYALQYLMNSVADVECGVICETVL